MIAFIFHQHAMSDAQIYDTKKFLTVMKKAGVCEMITIPDEKPEPPKNTMGRQYGSDFDEFWALVPHKIAKGSACDAYQKAIQRGYTAEQIKKGVITLIQYETERQRKGPDSFTPLHPATWLNGDRFLDEPGTDPTKPRESKLDRVSQQIEKALKVSIRGMDRNMLSDYMNEGMTVEEIMGKQALQEGCKTFSEFLFRVSEAGDWPK